MNPPRSGPAGTRSEGLALLLAQLRQHLGLVIGSLVLALVAALFEGTTMGILAMALETLSGADPSGGGAYDSLIAFVHEMRASLGVDALFLLLVGAAVASQMLRSGLEFTSNVMAFRLLAAAEADLRSRIFHRFMFRRFADMQRRKLGDLTSYIQQVDYVGQAIRRLTQMTQQILLLVIYVFVLVWLSWPMTVAAVAGALLLTASLRWIIATVGRIGEQFKAASVTLSERTVEFLNGLRLVRTFARERYAVDQVDEAIGASRSARHRGLVWQGSISPIVDSLTILGVAVFLGAGYLLLGGQGSASLPRLATFLFVLYRLAPRLRIVNDHYGFFAAYGPFLDRIAAELAIDDSTPPPGGGRRYRGLQREIVFDEVSMQYLKDERHALHEISFTIPRGSMVALVGESGAGKTTLADLLIRLHDPSGGAILVDGTDLRDLDWTDWRDRIGSVSQETFIFHRSIRDNIAFGRPQASEHEIIAAARAAHAHEFIMDLAQGYDTLVGDQGYRLSGGQRQRLAIARAVLRDPELLILDEATSDLDSRSERLIQEALGKLRKDRTVLSIAHRLSTIAMADQIVVLDHGTIVESGSHSELLERAGRYAKLWLLQRSAAAQLDAGDTSSPSTASL